MIDTILSASVNSPQQQQQQHWWQRKKIGIKNRAELSRADKTSC